VAKLLYRRFGSHSSRPHQRAQDTIVLPDGVESFDLYETHHDDMSHLDGSSNMPFDEAIDEHSNFRSYLDKLGFR